MKKYLNPLLAALIFASGIAVAQSVDPATGQVRDARFDLNFPGGSPRDLVKAVEKASGKTINVIISDDHNDAKMPPIVVKNVNVPELLRAVSEASHKEVLIGNRVVASEYRFITRGSETDENSVWFFYYSRPRPSPQVCRFYPLSACLEAGYKVEDITTAIETGWKMLGETNPPKISYHKDTKLLIAVGDPEQMNLIADVIQSLQPPWLKFPGNPDADKSKTEKPKAK